MAFAYAAYCGSIVSAHAAVPYRRYMHLCARTLCITSSPCWRIAEISSFASESYGAMAAALDVRHACLRSGDVLKCTMYRVFAACCLCCMQWVCRPAAESSAYSHARAVFVLCLRRYRGFICLLRRVNWSVVSASSVSRLPGWLVGFVLRDGHHA